GSEAGSRAPHAPAEKLVDRNAQRLTLDVEARILDGGDGMGAEPARGRPRAGVERRVDAPERTWVLADQRGTEAVDQGSHALAAALVELRPAGEAFVGGDLQEGIGVPAAIGVGILELYDLHFLPPQPRTLTSPSPAGLTTQVGFIRLAHLIIPKSGKPDFGWSILFETTQAAFS